MTSSASMVQTQMPERDARAHATARAGSTSARSARTRSTSARSARTRSARAGSARAGSTSRLVGTRGRTSTFRPEIQALRALAVTLVVVYHLNSGWLPGGYIGVDVFFVISGFLITGIMLAEIERTGRLRLRDFYARRARRILPASAVTLVVVTALGSAILPTTRWEAMGEQARASGLFVQNWLLASQSVDYLAEGAAASPFQHFWSLSIEEQFYFVWPGVLGLLALLTFRLSAQRATRTEPTTTATSGSLRTFRRRALLVLGMVTASSLALSVWMTAQGDPAAYFVSHTRAWELGAGGLLAFAGSTARRDERWRAALAWAGLAAIVWAAFVFSAQTPFPGSAALVPVLGTVAVIHAGRTQASWSPSHLMGRRAVQWVGDASYSLYLWHWPVIAILPVALGTLSATGDSLALAGLALVTSVLLAALSRRLVEEPFMHSARLRSSAARSLGVGLLGIVLAVSAGTVAGTALASVQRVQDRDATALLADPPPELGAASIRPEGYDPFTAASRAIVPAPADAREELPEGADGRCKSQAADPTTPVCSFGPEDATTTIALVGDSHMEQYSPAFEVLAEQSDWRVVTYFHSSCPFSTAQRDIDAERGGPCLEANEATLTALLGTAGLDAVVTSNRTAPPFMADGVRPDPQDGFRQVWGQLAEAGIPVAVIADNPLMLGDDATTDCVAEHPDHPQSCDRPRSDAMPSDHQLAPAADTPGVTLVDLTDRYCTDSVCPPVAGSVLVYRDEQHVTPSYMRTLAPYLGEALRPLGL